MTKEQMERFIKGAEIARAMTAEMERIYEEQRQAILAKQEV